MQVVTLFLNYPTQFLVTVLLPLISGIIIACGGYDSLKNRAKSEAQSKRIEENVNLLPELLPLVKRLPEIEAKLNAMYEGKKVLSANSTSDPSLEESIKEYKQAQDSIIEINNLKQSKDSEAKLTLSEKVLEIIEIQLPDVFVPPDVQQDPIILNIAQNTFKIIFRAPMRIVPRLEFSDIPESSTPKVVEVSTLGFTVKFEPTEVRVISFGYVADAEL